MNYHNIHHFVSAMLASTIATASAVEITVTTQPAGPVTIGAEVSVELAVAAWDPGDPQVDAIAFNVDFDTAVFEFVTGSGSTLADGSEYLALPTQGGGYNLDDDSSEVLVGLGRYIFGATDIGDGTAGSLGPDGVLGSFRLRAIGAGVGSISATANAPKLVFSDPGLFGIAPTGGVNLGTADVTVTPPSGVNYASWAVAIPFATQADALPGSDPEKDGRINLLEYFLDADPLVSDSERTPVSGRVNVLGSDYATLIYERPAGAKVRTDAREVGENSKDLAIWNRGVIVHRVSAIDPVTGRETVVLRSTSPLGNLTREFLRLLVELGP